MTQVLELANHQPVSVGDIHLACETLLGVPVSYPVAEGCPVSRPRQEIHES